MKHFPALLFTGFGQLFAAPFRIFFLSLALWACLMVPLWLLVLLSSVQLPLALDPLRWHQHEMLFGFLNAAIAGFLLTAVGTWTNTRPLHGWPLMSLWLIWLSGRLLFLLGADVSALVSHGIDMLFLPLVLLDASYRIARARQYRQLVVLIVIGGLWSMELGFHLAPTEHYGAAALVTALALMMAIGGRITPAFSRNWLRLRGSSNTGTDPRWLATASIVLPLALVPFVLLDWQSPIAILSLLAALLILGRLWKWRGWQTRAEPLLWILHLSLLWIPIALLLLAGGALDQWPLTVWVHAAGVGAMSSLILGVVSRVALGHSGRPLNLPAGMVYAYLFIQSAAVVRVLTALTIIPWQQGIALVALGWLLAFGLFLLRYTSILLLPRADGRPG